MRSDDFQLFVESFFGTRMDALRDGPNEAVLARLEGEERMLAEAMLLERLDMTNTRSAVGLGVLRSPKGKEPILGLLRAHGHEVQGLDAGGIVDLALALHRIQGDPRALDPILRVLGHCPHAPVRLHAVLALREISATRADDSLVNAMRNDPSWLVRTTAARVLLRKHGILATADERHPQVDLLIRYDAEVRRAAADAIVELLRARKPAPGSVS